MEFENHVGDRVSVRYRLDDGSATDVIGYVLRAGSRQVIIERRDASRVAVDRQRVVAARPVPQRPGRARPAHSTSAEELMTISGRTWPAAQHEPLGQWRLRACSGWTKRANSVLAVGDPGLSDTDLVTAIRAFYDRADLSPLAQVVVGSSADDRLTGLGWRTVGVETVTLTRDLDRPQPPGAPSEVTAPVPAAMTRFAIDDEPDDAWLDLAHPDVARTDLIQRREALGVLMGRDGARGVGFMSASSSTQTVATARIAIGGEWTTIGSLTVDPSRRRQGWARYGVARLLAHVASQADKAFVHVEADNSASLALHRSLGFTEHHRYRYLRPA